MIVSQRLSTVRKLCPNYSFSSRGIPQNKNWVTISHCWPASRPPTTLNEFLFPLCTSLPPPISAHLYRVLLIPLLLFSTQLIRAPYGPILQFFPFPSFPHSVGYLVKHQFFSFWSCRCSSVWVVNSFLHFFFLLCSYFCYNLIIKIY